MKSPLLIISKTIWLEHLKKALLPVGGIALLILMLSSVSNQNHHQMLDSFATMFIIMLIWISCLTIMTFIKTHYGSNQSYFPEQLFIYPISSWRIGSVFYWAPLSIIMFLVLLLGGFARLMGASIPNMDHIFMALCFISFELTFSLRMPFILLSLASFGVCFFWYFYLVPIAVPSHLPFYKGLVTIGYLLWGNLLFVGSTPYQRHHQSIKECLWQVVLPGKFRFLKAIPSIYLWVSKDSPIKALTWMETVRFTQNLWMLVGWLAVIPILIWGVRKLEWNEVCYIWLICSAMVSLFKLTEQHKDNRRAEHTGKLFLPVSDYILGQAEYRGYYGQFCLYSLGGLFIIGSLYQFDITTAISSKTYNIFTVLSFMIINICIIFPLLSLFKRFVSQYHISCLWIYPGLIILIMVGLMIPDYLFVFEGQKEITMVFGLLFFNLLVLLLFFGFYIWSLRESYHLNIINRTQLYKSIGIFTVGLLVGMLGFGLWLGISYILISNLLVGLSIVLLPMQLFPILVHKQRHQ